MDRESATITLASYYVHSSCSHSSVAAQAVVSYLNFPTVASIASLGVSRLSSVAYDGINLSLRHLDSPTSIGRRRRRLVDVWVFHLKVHGGKCSVANWSWHKRFVVRAAWRVLLRALSGSCGSHNISRYSVTIEESKTCSNFAAGSSHLGSDQGTFGLDFPPLVACHTGRANAHCG